MPYATNKDRDKDHMRTIGGTSIKQAWQSKIKELCFHAVSRRIAIAAPITVVIGLLRSWLGEESILVGVAVGLSAYVFADWLLSTKEDFRARQRTSWAFLSEHQTTAIQWAICFAMIALCFGSRTDPNEPAVKQIQSIVETFGLIAVVVVPILSSTFSTAVWGAWASVESLISRFLRGFTFYAMALWLVGNSGDTLYQWTLANPHDAAIGTVSLAIVWLVVRFSAGTSHGQERIARTMGVATAGMARRSLTTTPITRDNRYTAAHEAGHALVYAALDHLPADVRITVLEQPERDGTLGFISRIKGPHQLVERAFVEWDMLVLLAGKIGEDRAMGETTMGSSNDFTRWVDAAKRYLSNQYRGLYYPEPQNELELKHNVAIMAELQREQTALLKQLFDRNAALFENLADTLLEKRTLSSEELACFLAKVDLPGGFPRPVLARSCDQ